MSRECRRHLSRPHGATRHPRPLLVTSTLFSPCTGLTRRRVCVCRYGAVQNAAMAEANATAVESLGAIRTIQANTGELTEARRFAAAIRRFLHVVIVTVHTQTMVIFTQLCARLTDRDISLECLRAATSASPLLNGE